MKKSIIIYGIIAGLVVSAMVVFNFSGSTLTSEYGELFGYGSMIIAFSTIFVAIKSIRDKEQNGVISFKKAFTIGLGITLVATAIYIISWFIISNTIAQDFMANYFQQSIEKIKASGLPEDQVNLRIAETLDFQELYKNPIVKIGMTFLEIFPVGLIISLIAALILKRKTAESILS